MKHKVAVVIKKKNSEIGEFGEIKEVAAGYARNYLIPQGIALYLSDPRSKEILRQKEEKEKEKIKIKEDLEILARNLTGKTVRIKTRVTEKGTLYNTIGPDDVAKAMKEQLDYSVKHSAIEMGKIQKLGEVEVRVDLGHGITTKLKVKVEKE